MEYVICFSAVCLGFQQLVQCPFLCIPTQDLLFLFLISSFGFLYCVFPIVCGSVVICLLMNYRYDREKSLKVPRGYFKFHLKMLAITCRAAKNNIKKRVTTLLSTKAIYVLFLRKLDQNYYY
jgi:hypothetical protein